MNISSFECDVFTDIDSIRNGEPWSNSIEKNVSLCDIFVLIVTPGSLKSPHIEDEVIYAQRGNKTSILYYQANIKDTDLKWGFKKDQGIEFRVEYEVAQNLYLMIKNYKHREDEKESIKNQQSFITRIKRAQIFRCFE